MCGLAGWCCGAKNSWQLKHMLNAIGHRGPESIGTYESDHASLGHARLAIVDLAGGQQPIPNEDESVWIICNGEIYNYPQLRQRLIARGHSFRTHSDTEVVLHLYEEKGVAGLSDLNGQYAFAIWDQGHHQLILCRDRVGIHPLFYTFVDGCCYFSSEIKALLTIPRLKTEPDLPMLGAIWTFWSLPAGRTSFQGIYELPPAHVAVLEYGQQRLRTQRYWQLDFTASGLSSAEAGDALSELLEDAVNIRLQADVPVVTYLSGGLDSSLITALASKYTTGLHTFSLAFEQVDYDESSYQRLVAAYLGSQHHILRCDTQQLAAALPKMVYHTEAPQLRPGPISMMLLSEYVRQLGFKVVLTGEGADEFFLGYDLFKETAVRRFMARDPLSARRRALIRQVYRYVARRESMQKGLEFAFQAGLDHADEDFFSHYLRWNKTCRLQHYFLPEVQAQFRLDPLLSDLEQALPAGFKSWEWMAKAQALEITTFLTPYLLASQGDRASMAHAVEGRYPFLDHRLIELANALPVSFKLRNLKEDKYLLRQLARLHLPAEIAARPKVPYRTPMQSIVKTQTCGYIDELLSPEVLRAVGLFVPQHAHKLLEKVRKSASVSEMDEMALCGIITTQLWYQTFIQRSQPVSTSLSCEKQGAQSDVAKL
jgi:asparagine synthase (glutamine-hydrolysing)